MRRFFAICLAISLVLTMTIASVQAQDVSPIADNCRTATWTKAAGTYRLHFATKMKTETWWPGATINGRIYK